MKLSRKPCRIIGVRLGEVTANLLNPSAATLSAKFALVGPDGNAFGSHTKDRGPWSDKTMEAFRNFIDALESESLVTLFDDEAESAVTEAPASLSFPSVPTLGGPKRNDPP